MKRIGRILLRGLITILPLIITVYILIWIFTSMESSVRVLFKITGLEDDLYFPGAGLLAWFVIILAAGLIVQQRFLRHMFELFQNLLLKTPFVKSIYGSVQDFFSWFSQSSKKKFDKVAIVTLQPMSFQVIGLVTCEDLTSIHEDFPADPYIAVYLPMSYQIGGYTILVHRDQIQPVDMSFEDAMKFIVTAGISKNNKLPQAENPETQLL